MREFAKYQFEARLALPKGYFILGNGAKLRFDDLVWSYPTREFLRADSPEWIFPPLEYSEDLICAVRKAVSEFGEMVPTKRSYIVR